MSPRVAHWTKDPRAKKPRKAPEVPLGPLEVYPKTCAGCGKKVTQAGGCIEVSTSAGPLRYHSVRCMEGVVQPFPHEEAE